MPYGAEHMRDKLIKPVNDHSVLIVYICPKCCVHYCQNNLQKNDAIVLDTCVCCIDNNRICCVECGFKFPNNMPLINLIEKFPLEPLECPLCKSSIPLSWKHPNHPTIKEYL
jgi:hypothetical protein